LIDLAMPGDVDPAVDALEDAFLYGLADLEAAAMQGQAARRAAADTAWAILDEEVAAFLRRAVERRAVPAITALRARFEDARRQVLAETGGEGVDRATRLLVNRLLHAPSRALRHARAEGGQAEGLEAALRALFDLREAGSSGAEEEDKTDED
jgi:glutamyl-tRNA reductase